MTTDAIGGYVRTRDQATPDGLYTGTRAITVQGYVEANVKNGVEHEASALFTIAGLASNDTIIITSSLPISLKSRIISYTGDGVLGDIFEGPTYTGGINIPYQNANAINPVAGLSTALGGVVVTDTGVKAFATKYSFGNTSNQGQGATSTQVGNERILKPNTTYLLRLTSLDAASQSVASFLSWYEGTLDLPIT